jgi:predicted transcriptional regulator
MFVKLVRMCYNKRNRIYLPTSLLRRGTDRKVSVCARRFLFSGISKEGIMAGTTSIRLTDSQRARLYHLAKTLGTSPNATVGQLIDNAEIVPVIRREAVPTFHSGKADNRNALVSQGQGEAVAEM